VPTSRRISLTSPAFSVLLEDRALAIACCSVYYARGVKRACGRSLNRPSLHIPASGGPALTPVSNSLDLSTTWEASERFLIPPMSLFFIERTRVSLSEIDRQLLDRCLAGSPRAWKDFVDRFLGLVIHVANHTASARGRQLQQDFREDLVSEVFTAVVANDYAVLRRFQRNCSLATYLTVIARRVIVRHLMASEARTLASDSFQTDGHRNDEITRLDDADEVTQLMLRLDPEEARVVRMYHLEGMSYQEISREVGINENSIGPVLSRARSKMRQAAE
jgi:RNA polymerase sigma-70 factor, ECF subfamily